MGMNIILDLIVIAIIVIFALISAKRGFVRTLIEIVGFILVIIIANTASTPLADLTYDKAVEPAIIKSIEGMQLESGNIANLEAEGLPAIVQSVLGEEAIADFQQNITQNINSGISSAATNASQTVIKPLIINILSMLYVVIISVVLLFVVGILANLINKLFSFSVVGKINSSLGAVLGAVKGIIISMIVCTLITLIVSLTENGFLIFTEEAINNSFIFKLLCLKL